MRKKEASKQKFTPAEKRAYYQGYGAGRCGVTVGTDKFDKLFFGFKTEAERTSAIRGALDGGKPRSSNKRSFKK